MGLMKTYRTEAASKIDPWNGDYSAAGDRDGHIKDIWDGRLFQQYLQVKKGLFQDLRDIAFKLSLDGVPIHKSGKGRTITPILLQNLNLPPSLREKRRNVMVAMIIPGPSETPHLETFLFPLFREMKKLSVGVQAIDGDMKIKVADGVLPDTRPVEFTLRAWIVLAIGDQKAINYLTQMRGAGSKQGCRRCWHTGTLLGTLYYYMHTEENIRTLHLNDRKNFAQFVRDITRPEVVNDSILKAFGLKGPGVSPLLHLPDESVHYTRGVPYGLMHLIPIGVVELFVDLWRGNREFDYPSTPEYVLSAKQ